MSLVINYNLMAMNASRHMNASYARLADSTRKLSSGLRIDTAADDAAGLAIRELMKSDIATLNQGIRNSNDAISLIQTADGALQIIDEKLIRMKELAEQASTGTYDSIQRGIIESEYQQMASEITRIASATDFNGIKLLDGSLSAADINNPGAAHAGNGIFKGHELALAKTDGTLETPVYIEDAAGNALELIYISDVGKHLDAGTPIYTGSKDAPITVPPTVPPAPPVVDKTTQLTDDALKDFHNAIKHDNASLKDIYGGARLELARTDGTLKSPPGPLYRAEDPTDAGGGTVVNPTAVAITNIEELNEVLARGETVYDGTKLSGGTAADVVDYPTAVIDKELVDLTKQASSDSATWSRMKADAIEATEETVFISDSNGKPNDNYYILDAVTGDAILVDDVLELNELLETGVPVYAEDPANPGNPMANPIVDTLGTFDDPATPDIDESTPPDFALTELTNAVKHDVEVIENNNNWDLASKGSLKVHFGTGNDSSEDYYYIAIGDSTASALGIGNAAVDENGIPRDGHDISTQENAEKSLVALNAAIISKDNIRAHLGAMQNRLENTINNVTIQAENLQAAESQISSVDISTEMTELVRNQLLANAAVSMIAQANQFPQMAMKLLE